MKQRVGLVLTLAGMILLLEPNLDMKLIWENAGDWLLHYWPAGLILAGMLLVNPKRKNKKRSRS